MVEIPGAQKKITGTSMYTGPGSTLFDEVEEEWIYAMSEGNFDSFCRATAMRRRTVESEVRLRATRLRAQTASATTPRLPPRQRTGIFRAHDDTQLDAAEQAGDDDAEHRRWPAAVSYTHLTLPTTPYV